MRNVLMALLLLIVSAMFYQTVFDGAAGTQALIDEGGRAAGGRIGEIDP
ncbi:hypothetical protein IDH44_21515 [Paenibacillus sp. IB182496]|uniref:Uncharacterized protein n=1 Tax=Paenibacillus sabuli TaxID=2772509 RepID=A0A927BY63_9BACL|nr:hypothetical protein [Paenibacillus sabuli]MBD2847780.1 hypothetical protein [Paenibacillus sabuli]